MTAEDIKTYAPIATALGTVLAAIITGFIAAALKHRWDTQADRVKYERESAQRWDAELRQLYSKFLVEADQFLHDFHDFLQSGAGPPLPHPVLRVAEEISFIAPKEVIVATEELKHTALGIMTRREGMDIVNAVRRTKSRDEIETTEKENYTTYGKARRAFILVVRNSFGVQPA